MRPSLIVPRLREACPAFQNRVAGAIGLDHALEIVTEAKLGLPVPCAYVVWAGDQPVDAALSPLDQDIVTNFAVVVVVDARADDRGQDASERLIDAQAALIEALVGWTPDPARFSPVLYIGAPDDEVVINRAYGAAAFLFAAQTTTRALAPGLHSTDAALLSA